MKKLLFAIVLIANFTITSFAQQGLDVSTNPLVYILPTNGIAFVGSGEFIINNDFGVGVNFLRGNSSHTFFEGKYYFMPQKGADKLYIGLFGGPSSFSYQTSSTTTTTHRYSGFGFLGGYKLISRHNVVLELNAGYGRSFTNDGNIYYGNILVGFRFPFPKRKVLNE